MLEEGRVVNNTLIVSTGDKFNNVGRVELVVEDGEVTSKSATLLDYSAFENVIPNEQVLAAIEEVETAQEAVLDRVVGQTNVKLVGDRSLVRTGETNLGQLATAALIDLTGADVAITNGGGIRASIEAGDITMRDMVTVFPFGNTVMVKEISGHDLKAALEHGVSEYPNEKGAFPHTAGVTFTLNPYETVGNRVSDLKINGEAIDFNKMYTVATNDFMAAGGDDYTMFTNYPVKAEYNTLMDTLLAYVEKLGVIEGECIPAITVVTQTPAQEETAKPETNKVVGLRAYLEGETFEVKYTAKAIVATKGDITLTFTVGQTAYTATDADSNLQGNLSTALSLKDNVTYINTSDLTKILAELTA